MKALRVLLHLVGAGSGCFLLGPQSGLLDDGEDLIALSCGHDGGEVVGYPLHLIEQMMEGIISAGVFKFSQADTQAGRKSLLHLVR